METAAKLRAEAQHLRALSRYVTDPKASAELHAIIQALKNALVHLETATLIPADIGWLQPSAFDGVQPHLH